MTANTVGLVERTEAAREQLLRLLPQERNLGILGRAPSGRDTELRERLERFRFAGSRAL